MPVVHVESGSGRLLLRLPLVMAVLLALCIEVTRARAFQLDECPVGCSSHGACRQGLCDCAAGWSGQDCSYFLAAGGSMDEDDTLDEVEDCVDDCSRHGACAGGICHCDAGWGGLSCNVAAQCSETCRPPRGQCNSGSCVCAAGFFGPECGDALCPSNCFGHGSCNNGACECSQGWFGRLCDSQLDEASMCDPPCSNSGQCVSGQCYCGPGFTGIDCSMQVQVTPAQAATLAATSQSGLERSAQVPHLEVHTAPPPRFVQTTGMENRLHELQAELEDVQRRTKMLKPGHRSVAASPPQGPQSGNQHLMLTQVDGRGMQPQMPAGLEAVLQASAPAQPSNMKNNLEAVRRATRSAGSAADRLRHTAEKEFAEAAKRRVQSAIKTAHDRVKSIPGFEESGPTAPPVPTEAPVPVQSLSINFNRLPAAAHAAVAPAAPAAQDMDNEDSADTSEDTATAEESLLKVYADSASVPGAHSLMVASAPAPAGPPPVCESDCGGHGMCQSFGGSGTSCKCAPGWVGMLCDTQRCEHDCNGRGMCLKGRCLCGPGWLGPSCGYMRCPDDCSGVGYCFTGKCRCKTGYEGPSCAQVKPAGLSLAVKIMPMPLIKAPPPVDEHWEGMTLRAIPPKQCPSNCNGRGQCHTNGECACNVGYSGPACELFCPNECAHNGDCVEGACLCFAGFLGVDCSIAGCCSGHGSCDDPGTCVCDKGWDGDDCSLKLMCPDPACSGHGTCTSGKCHCTAGFSGGSCAIADGGCVPPCGPSGACNPISHKCECMGGAAGPTCLETVASCPMNCNNRGLCMNGMCMCGVGWMGADCGKKFFKPGQKPPPPAAKAGAGGDAAGGGLGGGMPTIAGLGGGAGGADDAGGDAVDDADAVAPGAPGGGDTGGGGGADGSKKEEGGGDMVLSKASGGMVCGEGGLCSGHGKCDTASAKCICEAMYFGDICEQQHCPGFFKMGKDCYGNGLCEMGQCQCAPGYGMAPFRLLSAVAVPQACMDKVCPVGCGMHGKCVEGQCICQQGWQGPNCKDPKCPNDCAGHGQCAFQSIHSPGQCICNYGWGGAGCQRVAVYAQLKKCPNDCAGNGLCMDGFCACNVGFKGPDCSDMVCAGMMTGPKCNQPRCPNDCSGRGLCMNGMCACWAFYAGAECQMPVVCQETCGDVCEAPGKEAKCQNCIGMCESSAPRSNSVMGGPSLGAHNPFEDLQSTLLQQNTTAVKPGHRSEWPAARSKTKKSHSHREVYQRPEEPHGTAFISTGEHAHAAHHHGHHHEEVSATQIIPALRSVF